MAHSKNLGWAALTVGIVLILAQGWPEPVETTLEAPIITTGADTALTTAIEARSSGVAVSGQGRVVRILADDLDGSRHQRVILDIGRGCTLLIAHNIDLAPRLDSLQPGDTLAFNGVFEWNERGGVVHWTHHDPRGIHAPGWLEFNGQRYQ